MSNLTATTAKLSGSEDLQRLRQQAAGIQAAHAIPDRRHEDWKYTDISRFTAMLGDCWWQAAERVELAETRPAIDGLDSYRIVFHQGYFQPQHSNLPEGVMLKPLSQLLAEPESGLDGIADLFAVDTEAPLFNTFLAANAALASDGLCLCIADGLRLEKPIYMLHSGEVDAAHLLSGMMVGRGAEAVVIEHFTGNDSGATALTNSVTHIQLKAGATLQHYRLQQEQAQQLHLARVDVRQHRDSHYTLHAVELGAALARADILVKLVEPGATCELNGLFVASGRQHIDHHTRIEHAAPHCTSRECYRTVLDGRAHAVFNGKIVVAEGAVKTDSSQSNANMLLSAYAEIDTKPELEIYNDDVKCAHGVTVGQLDENQLFYLKSRGLSADEAHHLLTFAFADEVLASMPNNTIRRFIERQAFSKLPNMGALEEMFT